MDSREEMFKSREFPSLAEFLSAFDGIIVDDWGVDIGARSKARRDSLFA